MNRRLLSLLGLLLLASAFASFYLLYSEFKSPEAALPSRGTSPAVAMTPPSVITVSIVEGGAATQVETTARTVGEALWRAGYRLYRADEARPALDSAVTPSLTITIDRARPVILQADGRTLPTRTRRATVGEALADAGLALAGEDYSIPAADQPLPADGIIRVVRVRTEVLTDQQIIPYETVYQALADAEIDNVRQLQAGVNGVKQRRTRVRYEDGGEVSRAAEGERVAQTPTPRVIGYGTQIVVRTLDTPDGPIAYWRAFTMYATAYSPARSGTSPTARWYGITASGKPLTKGLAAIDHRLIPFGTQMYVPGYGFAEAADTGGGVKGRWIDLGYDDSNYVSWHQTVTVYFLTPLPPADSIAWIIPPTVP
jgi:uncharacterized protein YabE (DUF348 family)